MKDRAAAKTGKGAETDGVGEVEWVWSMAELSNQVAWIKCISLFYLFPTPQSRDFKGAIVVYLKRSLPRVLKRTPRPFQSFRRG
jgi:hypothetical protein